MWWMAFILQVILGLLFAFSGITKLTGDAEEIRVLLAIPTWFWTLTAFVEIVGAVGLLAGLWSARLAIASGLWLAATMAGGILAHLRVDDATNAVPATVLMLLSLAVAWLRLRATRRSTPAIVSGLREPEPAGR